MRVLSGSKGVGSVKSLGSGIQAGSAFVYGEEHARLLQLLTYQVLDSDPEPAYDELTVLAARCCQAPAAVLALLDVDRVWFKARMGTIPAQVARAHSFCEAVVTSRAPLRVGDALTHPDLAQGDLVRPPFGARACLAYPLETAAGSVLGSLEVLDQRARNWSREEANAVCTLARQATAQLELVRASHDNAELASRLQGLELQWQSAMDAAEFARTSRLRDGVCQDLAGLVCLIQAAIVNCKDAEVAERLAQMKALTQDTLHRSLTPERRSLEIPYRGLRLAMQSAAKAVQRSSGIACALRWLGTLDVRSSRDADYLLHIAQGAAQRAGERRGCLSISIRMRLVRSRILLDIIDDGEHVEGAGASNEELWLQMMRLKGSGIPATLKLIRRPLRGNIIRCVLCQQADERAHPSSPLQPAQAASK